MVPDSCWHSNLRSLLTPAQWDIVRREAYARAGGKCMLCGAEARRLEAHEQWEYDEKNCVQRLADVVAVCKSCHEVIHIGRTALMGREREAEAHFMKVNGCTYAEYRKALGEATEAHRRRNKVAEWALDLAYLKKFLLKLNGTRGALFAKKRPTRFVSVLQAQKIIGGNIEKLT